MVGFFKCCYSTISAKLGIMPAYGGVSDATWSWNISINPRWELAWLSTPANKAAAHYWRRTVKCDWWSYQTTDGFREVAQRPALN